MLRQAAMLAAGLCLFSPAGQAASAVGHASVTLLSPLGLTEQSALDFGQIGIAKTGGTVVLAPTGALSGSAGYSFAGGAAAGSFQIAGQPSTPVTISFSSGNLLTGPGPALALGGFTHNAGTAPALDSSGHLVLAVGATLAIGVNQPLGSYSGSYTVTVNY